MGKTTRRALLVAGAASLAGFAGFLAWRGRKPHLADGVVWQLDHATVDPHGTWQALGARELLIQWSIVDDIAFFPGAAVASAPRLPDWERIAKEPWAQEVILGLAGRFDEGQARSRVAELVELSRSIIRWRSPLNVVGWYFPVEIDPTWSDAPAMAALLTELPRPLWVSVYDSANVGANTVANWLTSWLPNDVGVFFQDGVGVHARSPEVAREYAEALEKALGGNRLRIIAEAFRPLGQGFRAATAEELRPQLDAYRGYRTYLFDGPHYVSDGLVDALLR